MQFHVAGAEGFSKSTEHEAPRDVWVWVEHDGADAKQVTAELLAEARRLAKLLGGRVSALLFGAGLADVAASLGPLGADSVLAADHAEFARYQPEAFTATAAEAIRTRRPYLVLFPSTALAEDLACRTSFAVERRLLRGCVNFEIGGGRDVGAERTLSATRPVYEGRFQTTESCDGPPYLATMPPGTVSAEPADPSRRAPVIEIPVRIPAETWIETVRVVRGDPGRLDLTEADVIIAGGRGLGGPEGFVLLQELADELGGVVGATRPAVDDHWVPFEKQVGQTGRVVRPKLYVACGISGAIQHLMGMRDSGTIVVINKDPRAPIFDVATLGAEGDLHELVPALVRRIRERKAAGARPA